MLRIACCSDSHGCPPDAVDEAGLLAWLHAGDLIDGADTRSVDAMRRWVMGRQASVLVVRGNHDCALAGPKFDEMDISGRVVKLKEGLFVAGVGWNSRVYFEVPGEADLEPVCRIILRQALRLVMPSDRLILLTHYPADIPDLFRPPVPSEGHTYRCVRQLVEELRPVVVVQGHVHDWFTSFATWQARGQASLIVNPGPAGAILSLPEHGPATCAFA